MAQVTTPSGISLEFDGPEDLTWGEAKEISARMNRGAPEDVEFALAVMIKSWYGDQVEGRAAPTVERDDQGDLKRDPAGNPIVHTNGLTRIKMRYVNEIAEVIMAAATAEGKV